MDYPSLLIALLLPWLAGYLWLAVIDQRFNPATPNLLRQIGYGLFLGYAGLQGTVLAYNRLFGSVDFWPILALIGLITAIGAAVLVKTRPSVLSKTGTAALSKTGPAAAASGPSTAANALFWLLIAWTTVHLLLVAIEILHRPIFAWDAWLNWMYRAKAWFFAGHIFVMDAPAEWLSGTGKALYNVAGNHYPTLVPVLALWAATALGQWSETLVNLPVLLCGVALGLGMYGQCRELGLQQWLSALCAYLLLSIPLVDTHLSLAGQADIWMVGFTGLGFVALLHGIVRNNAFQVLLGLGVAAIGIATKMEGVVWFLAALLTLALAKRTGITATALLLAVSIPILGWLIGVTYVELPLLGGIGFAEGQVHIPLMGTYKLQSFELWDDYQDNFFEGGTWHLLWTFILLSVISLWFLPAGTLRRAILAFYSVALCAQLFIFEGTESGQWAEDWTAINRLPLHFAPPLVFLLGLQISAFVPIGASLRPIQNTLRIAVLGLIITLAGALIYLQVAHPGGRGTATAFSAQDMRIVVGKGRLAGNIGVIDQYQNNIAILSSGPVQVDAGQFNLLSVDTRGDNQKRATFFWRNGQREADLHSTQISGIGTRYISLNELPEWQGNISELGLIFYSDEGRSAEFHGLEIRPHSLGSHLKKLAHDWRETSLWTQKSVHFLPAGAPSSTIPLPVLLGAWLLITVVAAIILGKRAYTSVLLCALLAWTLLDLRWTGNSLVQAINTTSTYPLVTATYLDFGDDKYTRQLIEQAMPDIEGNNQRTVIMAEEQSMRFQMLRAKYHALPAAALVHEGRVKSAPAKMADYILVLKQRYADSGHKPATPEAYARVINKRNNVKAEPVWDTKEGFLLQITPKTDARQQKTSAN